MVGEQTDVAESDGVTHIGYRVLGRQAIGTAAG